MLKELLHRLGSPTPVFFRKVRALGGRLGAAGLGLVGLPAVLPAAAPLGLLHAAAALATGGSYLIVAGTVVAAVASLACEAPEAGADAVEGSGAAGPQVVVTPDDRYGGC